MDLYKLTATAGSSITAITSQPVDGDAMDTVLRLFNSSGTQLAVNDNFTGLYSRLDYTLAASGTYYIGVSGAGNASYNPNTGGSGTAGSTGDYRLDLSLDAGDTLATAALAGLVLEGSFTQPNASLGDGPFGSRDVDFYRLSAPANSTLKAATGVPTGGTAMNTVLRLFDNSGAELAINDDFGGLYSRLDYNFTDGGHLLRGRFRRRQRWLHAKQRR